MIRCLLVVCSCLALGVSAAQASDNGSHSFHIETQMTPSAAAPAGSSIGLKLQAENENGRTEAELELKARGLPIATYFVSATLKSNGSTVQIGTFNVTNNEGETEIEFSSAGHDDGAESGDDDDEQHAPFPPNVDPLDIATVSVSFSNGTAIFTADLTQPTSTNATRTANVQLTPGPATPNATGMAVLNAFVSGGKIKGTLQVSAIGLPSKLQLNVTINGLAANTRKVTSNNAGAVNLKIGPKGKTSTVAPGVTLFDVSTLRLTDKFGNVVLSGSF